MVRRRVTGLALCAALATLAFLSKKYARYCRCRRGKDDAPTCMQ